MDESFLNLLKTVNPQIQGTYLTMSTRNTKRTKLLHNQISQAIK